MGMMMGMEEAVQPSQGREAIVETIRFEFRVNNKSRVSEPFRAFYRLTLRGRIPRSEKR